MQKIRKQVYDLTAADLHEHPMWEFAGDEEDVEGQDEATVRPLDGNAYDPQDYGVVRTKFTLADGTVMIGYITPPIDAEIEPTVHPQIVTEKGQVGLWLGIMKPSADDLSNLYQLLDRTPEQVFPLRYTTDFPIVGGSLSGHLDGFQGFGEGKPRPILTFK